ncbi:MAG: hypothetical protein KC900_10685 [Candidatus Omnitrophica bacterium]|nr:hypothetical protein [Candidatus Omnitrophota bacterium]
MSKLKLSIWMLFVLVAVLSVPQVSAEPEGMEFDRKQEYDIYFFSSESQTSVLENVTIMGFKKIAGKEFLVISSKGFKLTEESGYIDFASVIAILPDSHFRVRKSDGIRIRDKH